MSAAKWYELTMEQMRLWEEALKSEWFHALDDKGKMEHFRAGALLGIDVMNAASNYVVNVAYPASRREPGVLRRLWHWLF